MKHMYSIQAFVFVLLSTLTLEAWSFVLQQQLSTDPAYPPFKYQGKTYYIHSSDFDTYQAAIDSCRDDGGILAEINNEEEYNAIRNYLNTTNGLDAVFVGGTDQAEDGRWVLPSNNEELPFTDWGPQEPYPGDYFDCLSLFVHRGWSMFSLWCYKSYPSAEDRFLCEVQ